MANSISENENFKEFVDGLHDEIMEKMTGNTNTARLDVNLTYELENSGTDVKVSVTGFSTVTNDEQKVLGTFTA